MSESTSSGVGLPTVLGAIFITLKLTGHIAWSWWWVLSPFWVSALLWLVLIVAAIAIAAIDT